ncbi:PP2C family serine/threonine-protein phosphatase [Streptomyces angustmyceticus]|uniref:PP2C family serine/threonine-protein phosphatase n=1 Tax=Streptomyces angustmyceticus TaxID=285578 RepID=UPI0021B01D17|nr:PP2C family serine/threonine-protein phosphatase [Streptomyces angustmyceticus]
MGVTGPSRCPGCDEPLNAGDNFCGRCGADLLAPAAPPAYGAPPAPGAVPPPPPLPPSPPGPPGPPPPDPQARLPYGDPAAAPSGHVPPPPGHAPAVPGQAAAAAAPAPADPRVAGYEAVADAAAAGSGAPAAEEAAPAPAPAPAAGAPAAPSEAPALCAVCRSGAVGPDGYCEQCGHARPRERDHMERELAGVAAVSDLGHRHHRNEDFFALRSATLPDGSPAVVAVVCDGVSSATRPDEASAAASEAAGEALQAALPHGTHPQQAMHEAILAASTAVDALAADPAADHDEHHRQNAPACTFVGAVVGGGLLTVGWVGDSRVYWIPDDRTAPPARLTEDDSWAAQMVANNLMSEAEANADERAHAITGWLGADAYEVEPHTATFKPDGPGVVVVCTDGLWNYAESAEQMAAVLPHDAPAHPLDSARTLVTHALDGGGHDNVTVALVPFPAPAGQAAPA